MIYVMSDIHGCYEKYIEILKKINFKINDKLYILGDVADRGNDGIKILLDMMQRPNIVPLLGNHEYMAYRVLKKLGDGATQQNFYDNFDSETTEMLKEWIFNGGITTLQAYLKLDKQKRKAVTEYLGEFELYEELNINGNKFVLVHAGLADFDKNKDLSEYGIYDIICGRCDYSKQYYPDKIIVTGHTPTYNIDKNYKGKIYKANNHIAIDCGAVYGGRLGCICLDTQEEFYV